MKVRDLVKRLRDFDEDDDVVIFTHFGSHYGKVHSVAKQPIRELRHPGFQEPVVIQVQEESQVEAIEDFFGNIRA